MYRLVLPISIVVSVLLVVGSYFLSNRIYGGNDVEQTYKGNDGERGLVFGARKVTTQTKSFHRPEISANTNTEAEDVKGDPR